MNSNLKISFCIPTLNRGDLINDSILSIINQNIPETDYEIIIVDGGSVDNTKDILDALKNKYNNIHVFYEKIGNGVGADLITAIKNASGIYCWFFSDDDCLEPNVCVEVIDKLISNNVSSAITNYQCYDRSMNHKISTVKAINSHPVNLDKIFINPNDFFNSIGMHSGFISSVIVNRCQCLDVIESSITENNVNNPWIVVYILGFIQKKYPISIYIGKICVRNRTNNDSFSLRYGEFNRQLIAHKYFYSALDELFPSKLVANNIKRDYLKFRMPRSILRFKSKYPNFILQYNVYKLYFEAYRSFLIFWLLIIPMILLPNFIYKLIYDLYFYFIKLSNKKFD